MFEQYWNSASLLRASIISAGIPEDVADLVTARTRDNAEVLSTFILAGVLVVFIGLGMSLLVFALFGFLRSAASVSPSFIGLYVPQLATLAAIMASSLLIVRVWEELRYLIFIRIALNQSTLGRGALYRAAVRRASGLQGDDYVRKVVSWPLQVGALLSGGFAVAVAIISLL